MKALRKRAGFKAYELARMIGYGSAQWSAYENGRSPIPRAVEYAARWCCQPQMAGEQAVEPSLGDRLIEIIKEAINDTEQDGAGNHRVSQAEE